MEKHKTQQRMRPTEKCSILDYSPNLALTDKSKQ